MDVLGFGGAPRSLDPLADMFGAAPDAMSDEMVPVDQFFHSYIEELSRSKRPLDMGGMAAASKAARMAGQHTPAGLQPQYGAAPAAAFNGGGTLHPGLMQMPGMLPPGYVAGGGAPPFAVAANGGMGMGMGATGGVPGLAMDLPLPLDGSGGYGAGAAPPSGSLSRGGSESDRGGGEARSSHRGKTVKQQEANKVAQQRYRERKKQKFQEMEAQVEALTQQLAALQALQARNRMLEGMNGELQAQLLTREKEVERLRAAIDTVADGGVHPDSPEAAAEAAARLCADAGCVPCEVQPQDLKGIDFRQGFKEQIERLQQFLEQHELIDSSATMELSSEVQGELAQIVGRSCQLCQAALRADGVRVMELISRDPAALAKIDDAVAQQRWERCLDSMQLSPAQQDQLLLNRKAHLQQMRSIYQERHNLNMQAMSLMLPHSSRNPAEDNTVEGRLANMSQGGYLHVARSSAELSDVLDKIKDNLRQEQRAVMDINCTTVAKVLSPLQSAHYLLNAYPQHCDALALGNTLAKRLGWEEVSNGLVPGAQTCCGTAEVSTGCC